MEIVKKNILSIVCGVVALLALIALAYPIGGMYAAAQEKLVERKKENDKLNALRTARRTWPVIDPVSNTQQPLNHFPNESIIKKGNEVKSEVHKQAEEMMTRTVTDNRHEPVLADILPNPGDRRFDFQRAYMDEIQTKIPALLRSVTPPGDEVIAKEALKLWTDTYDPKLITVGGQQVNYAEIRAEYQAAAAKLPEKLRRERADQYKVYLDSGALVPSHAMQTAQTAPNVSDIWYAQNQLWVEEDIAAAINRVNQPAASVKESPVKQIVKIDIPDDATQYVMMAASGAAPGAAPAPEDPAAAAGKAYTRSPTGRVCNSLYDVIHFTLTLNVDARQIPAILAEIQRGKLITIYQMDATSVDAQAAAEDKGYIYGPVPVATLTMQGEELFLREWTTKLMPEGIKTQLGVVADPNAKQ